MMRALVALQALAAPALAYRRQEAAQVGPEELAGVSQFLAWASQNCEDCGATLGNLLKGIDDAHFLKGSTWDGSTLTVTLTEEKLYGEIAATSRVPVMWTLDNQLTFIFSAKDSGATDVRVSGISTEVSPQGLQLYREAMAHSKVDPTKCADQLECITIEVNAAGKYLSEKWSKMKKMDGKISRIMKTLYGRSAIYYAVLTQGSNFWPEIFYTYLMQTNVRLTGFVFEGGRVYATGESLATPEEEKMHLPQKVKVFGRKMIEGTTGMALQIALKFGRSSFNFAVMMGYGNGAAQRKLYEDLGIKPADVDAIANLFARCADTKAGELPECSGSTPGRIGWSPVARA